jgi:hypothetical protein
LIFTVSVASSVTSGAVIVSINVSMRGDHR